MRRSVVGPRYAARGTNSRSARRRTPPNEPASLIPPIQLPEPARFALFTTRKAGVDRSRRSASSRSACVSRSRSASPTRGGRTSPKQFPAFRCPLAWRMPRARLPSTSASPMYPPRKRVCPCTQESVHASAIAASKHHRNLDRPPLSRPPKNPRRLFLAIAASKRHRNLDRSPLRRSPKNRLHLFLTVIADERETKRRSLHEHRRHLQRRAPRVFPHLWFRGR